MQSNYKRLGDYIQLVDERNSGLEISNLVGLTINKEFIPSVANTIGSDMANYKIIRNNRFACSLMQVRRDKKIPMALFREDEPAIISQAYPVFEIIDTSVLLPEYLMMWFSRAEFDRQACFYAVGGVRGSLEWNDFCDFTLPIPDIEEQQALVDEYQTIERRIQLNEQLCQKLEETAQALYRKYFVEDIDTEDLPEGWRWGKLEEVVETQYGYTETATSIQVGPKFLRITDIVNESIDWSNVPYCNISKADYEKYKLKTGDIVVSRTGANIGWAKQIKGRLPDAVFASFLVRLKVLDKNLTWMIGALVESQDFKSFIYANQQGSAQPQANANIMVKYPLIIPDITTLLKYNMQVVPINKSICIYHEENQKLKELLSLLLVKMGRKEEK